MVCGVAIYDIDELTYIMVCVPRDAVAIIGLLLIIVIAAAVQVVRVSGPSSLQSGTPLIITINCISNKKIEINEPNINLYAFCTL